VTARLSNNSRQHTVGTYQQQCELVLLPWRLIHSSSESAHVSLRQLCLTISKNFRFSGVDLLITNKEVIDGKFAGHFSVNLGFCNAGDISCIYIFLDLRI
jgi:hypothetical protein